MKFSYVMVLLLFVCGAAAAQQAERTAIDKTLDDFHDAAAHGDKDRYLGLMTDDAVFMPKGSTPS